MTDDARAVCAELRAAIARTGWSETARRSGVDRTNLHRTFAKGKGRLPTFITVALVAEALGFRLSITPLLEEPKGE